MQNAVTNVPQRDAANDNRLASNCGDDSNISHLLYHFNGPYSRLCLLGYRKLINILSKL